MTLHGILQFLQLSTGIRYYLLGEVHLSHQEYSVGLESTAWFDGVIHTDGLSIDLGVDIVIGNSAVILGQLSQFMEVGGEQSEA